MSTLEQQQQNARGFVEDLLKRRLENGGIPTTRPGLYFQCADTRPRGFPANRAVPAGTELRVQTWRKWSGARITFDDATGELVGWQIARYADPPTHDTISEAAAVAAVAAVVEIPPGAERVGFSHYEYAAGRQVARVEWRHMHQGLRVDGDYLWAVVHPGTRRVVEFARRWHEPRPA